MKIAFLVLAAIASSAVCAGPIADSFRAGLFGLAWGASVADIEAKFPGGKWRTAAGIRSYTVQDSRTVLGIERPRSSIAFALDAAGGLSAAVVEFPANSDTLTRVTAAAFNAFGSPPKVDGDSAGLGGYVSSRWPPDDGITLSLFGETGMAGVRRVGLSIAKAGTAPPAALGFK